MVDVRSLRLDGVFEIVSKRFFADRGFFSKTWVGPRLSMARFDVEFVHDDFAHSHARDVLRGADSRAHPFADKCDDECQ